MLPRLKSQKINREELLRAQDSISQEARDSTTVEVDSEIEVVSTIEATRESEIIPGEDFKTELNSTSKINEPFKLIFWWRFRS